MKYSIWSYSNFYSILILNLFKLLYLSELFEYTRIGLLKLSNYFFVAAFPVSSIKQIKGQSQTSYNELFYLQGKNTGNMWDNIIK